MSQIEKPPDGISEINWCELDPNCPWKPSTNPCGIEIHLSHFWRERKRIEIQKLIDLATGTPEEQQEFRDICGRAAGLFV